MKILILVLPFLFSCSTYVKTVSTRMISPESQGKGGMGSLEMRVASSKKNRLDFENDETTNPMKDSEAVHSFALVGELGILEKLDVFVLPSLAFSPTIFGAKYQFIGSPRKEASKGNFSGSVMAGYGRRSSKNSDDGDLNDAFNENVSRVELNHRHQDVGLIFGYRWHEKFLHYVNGVYLNEKVDGKVTTDSNSLNRTPFKYKQDGMIYSTGFIHYFAKAQWKLDYSHFVSDWSRTHKQTTNSLSASLGFNW